MVVKSIQDDIFNVLENYVIHHDMPFELLRYPIADVELCACTFIRQGRMFVMVNSAIPLSKQIFAAAHELYHIYCYFEDMDFELLYENVGGHWYICSFSLAK